MTAEKKQEAVTRRDFLKGIAVGAVATVAVSAGVVAVTPPKEVIKTETVTKTTTATTTAPATTTTVTTTAPAVTTGPVTATIFPASKGYIFYDPKKCSTCRTCMLACSLAHEGKANLSLARIQMVDDVFGQYPTDIEINVCRQCPDAPCVKACPVPGALYIDKEFMNVRTVDASKCTGCKICIKACPFTPSMVIWKPAASKAAKCDLCKDTPYWSEKGKLACVEACPMRALKFSTEPPSVPGRDGYIVNLRGPGWKWLGVGSETKTISTFDIT